MHSLRGRVILLLDDDLVDAQRILQYLRLRQASVLGPVPNVAFALEIIQTERQIDYALVDLTLQDSDTFPVADALVRRQIPFSFLCGDEDAELPPEYRHIRCRRKPVALPELVDELKSSFEKVRVYASGGMGTYLQRA